MGQEGKGCSRKPRQAARRYDMVKARILVVDDEEGILKVCAGALHKLPDAEIILESQSRRAAEQLCTESFDLLITDIRMPEVDGMELLQIARQHDPNLTVLMLTGFPSVETAVRSMKLGAVDYLSKPLSPRDLLTTVRHLLEERRLREGTYSLPEIIGKVPAMQVVFETLSRQTIDQEAALCFTGLPSPPWRKEEEQP
ncbi:MAG: response regulator [Candidatus Tectomicrobia bacterium]|uniref:Response regulator n=1 Tax=Tectimicrobiota bacterium TaxID=2528274 RepID=A0A932CR72_UNCTE|nr:response regulator [Candidatus Tectomicrobia bacterium]